LPGKEEAPQAYYEYVEEADDDAGNVSRKSEAHPAVRERICKSFFTLPIITPCKAVTYKRMGIASVQRK